MQQHLARKLVLQILESEAHDVFFHRKQNGVAPQQMIDECIVLDEFQDANVHQRITFQHECSYVLRGSRIRMLIQAGVLWKLIGITSDMDDGTVLRHLLQLHDSKRLTIRRIPPDQIS